MVKKKPKVGRPTAYKPEYCQQVIEHMKGGLSIASFAVSVGVSRETLWKWGRRYPEFRNACEIAKDASQIWFEKLALAIASGQHKTLKDDKGVARYKDANPGMLMFLMSRRFRDYHDPKARMFGGYGGDEYQDDHEFDDESEIDKRLEKQMERHNARTARRKKGTA